MSIDHYIAEFGEDPGYLDYGRVGPLSRAAAEESTAFTQILERARYGSFDAFADQDSRVRAAAALLTGFPTEQIVFQPNTTQGLMHALFGLTGGVLLSDEEFPSLPIAAVRAQQALQVVRPRWLEAERGRVTPGFIRDRLDAEIDAVAVSLVDSYTGYLCDLEGIRQVIGDRLLIVDAVQGFGVVDAPWQLADVVVSGGQKWCRAGWGTGLMALSARALDQLTPVFSGYTGTDEDADVADDEVWGEVPPPSRTARGYRVSNPDPIAEARFAAALEEIAFAGVPAINAAITERVTEVIDLADEFAIAVSSSRDEQERAGIVVLEPPAEQVTLLAAALHNHGVTATIRPGTVRLSVHAGTSDETIDMLRAAFVSYATAAVY
ncbi:aminotransferase class V-fold PLP-dependent enzyme [Agromyces aerolatus]|uniref:aminotransferase class V-fold PLP-dependent enzyme n=1 Tax=Agromyces sp. LY-1074 TaxID=3074080 RepID=UPI0028570ABF|nr:MULTISPECIES: aminotransferase class V-fold PLP-dependent enzyme [unclassified Agromyces]MDR5698853.1 aminotransferase class V-fold PLP-dependent enzyme [Agromyces sp. LY-1074]MDR5705369.1 aminotransferase class V-fold PLP-dependent enzyme [Agromyces sp. LY-1358]